MGVLAEIAVLALLVIYFVVVGVLLLFLVLAALMHKWGLY